MIFSISLCVSFLFQISTNVILVELFDELGMKESL